MLLSEIMINPHKIERTFNTKYFELKRLGLQSYAYVNEEWKLVLKPSRTREAAIDLKDCNLATDYALDKAADRYRRTFRG